MKKIQIPGCAQCPHRDHKGAFGRVACVPVCRAVEGRDGTLPHDIYADRSGRVTASLRPGPPPEWCPLADDNSDLPPEVERVISKLAAAGLSPRDEIDAEEKLFIHNVGCRCGNVVRFALSAPPDTRPISFNELVEILGPLVYQDGPRVRVGFKEDCDVTDELKAARKLLFFSPSSRS